MMPSRFLRTLLCLCLLLPGLLAAAGLPSASSVQASLDALAKQDNLTVSQQKEQDDLKAVLANLDAIAKEQDKLKQQQTTLSSQPSKLRELERQIKRLGPEPAADSLAHQYAAMNLTDLEGELDKLHQQMQTTQQQLNDANALLVTLQGLPERTTAELSRINQRNQQLRNQVGGPSEGKESNSPARQRANTELALLELQQKFREQELDNRTAMLELVNKQVELLNLQLARAGVQAQVMQQQINNKRLALGTQALDQLEPDLASKVAEDPLYRKERKLNLQISRQLIASTEEIQRLTEENIKVKGWLERVSQTEQTINEQIAILQGSLLLSRIIYQQRQMLIDPNISSNLEEQIADLRLVQFDVNQQRDRLYETDSYLDEQLAQSDPELAPTLRLVVAQLLEARTSMLEQLNRQLGNELSLAINLQQNQHQLTQINESLKFTLQQQIFWVTSNKPLDWNWVKSWPGAILAQLTDLMSKISPSTWWKQGLPFWLLSLPLLLVAGLLQWHRNRLTTKLGKLNKEVGHLLRDSHLHTPLALLLTLLRILPGGLLILVLGLLTAHCGLAEPKLILRLALQMAVAYLAFGLLLRITRPDGVAISHFGGNPGKVANRHQILRRLWRTLLPLIVIASIGRLDPSTLATDVLGRSITLIMLFIISYQLLPIGKTRNATGQNLLLVGWSLLFALVPLCLIGLTVTGYYYTALELIARLINSFYLLALWAIVYQTGLRSLALAARRLAYRRALSRRQQQKQQQEDADGGEAVEEPPMSLELISQQSIRLLNLTLFVLFGMALYLFWSDLVAILTYLDKVPLWHQSVTLDGSTVLQPVSLLDLLKALTLAGVAIIMTRNLPGLLEVLVLAKLQLAQGTAYTVKTVLSYVITAIGVLGSLSALGMDWSKLQWLVAALSVGLGFGLQEIFANFVSGIIILFERPVRIGDTITLGEFSGTVSKIRIRATTVTDFDRKEIIIPNKAFVTERLINWSLSDTVTRVIVRVGVAYGSDLDLTRQLLLRAAQESERVMKDPEPIIYFLNFGASTLDHELRFYVQELGDRNPTIDELNRRIDKLFKEHGIEISFNQVDVFIKNLPTGEELNVSPTLLGAAAGGAVEGQPQPLPPAAPASGQQP
ncbi:mechanosensitive channel MscK [Pseudaeromonas paramecii]|uniref:Mechanosensitive channel MscK n=1 Tax=Pseudaeromonas paramecii TaxID=2138166 RepID=A0ABP8QG40_9GAMM